MHVKGAAQAGLSRERRKRACQGSGPSGPVKGAAQAGLSRERRKRACQGSGASGHVKGAALAGMSRERPKRSWARMEADTIGIAVGLLDVHWHSSWASTPHFQVFRGGRRRHGCPLSRPGLIGASITSTSADLRSRALPISGTLATSPQPQLSSGTCQTRANSGAWLSSRWIRAAAARRLCRARRSAAMRAGARGAAKAEFAGLSRPWGRLGKTAGGLQQ